jgi:sugar phosphate isomerase/epimerase
MPIIRYFSKTLVFVAMLLSCMVCASDVKTLSPQISVQLWSVKTPLNEDYVGTLRALSKMGFQGVEFAGVFGPYADDPQGLKDLLDSLGLKGSGAHVPFALLNAENFAKTVAFFKTLEVDMLIIPWDERAWDPKGILEVVASLTQLSKQLAEHGMKVGFHNHNHEFEEFQGSTYWDYLAQHTPQDVVLQQDVGWTTYAGKDPVEYVRRYPGRTLTTHYKVRLPEGTVGKLPIIGQDTIDWPALIQANIEVGGTRWLVVEQEEYPNGLSPLEAVQASKQGLDKFLAAR